jgi:hypothetical protein
MSHSVDFIRWYFHNALVSWPVIGAFGPKLRFLFVGGLSLVVCAVNVFVWTSESLVEPFLLLTRYGLTPAAVALLTVRSLVLYPLMEYKMFKHTESRLDQTSLSYYEVFGWDTLLVSYVSIPFVAGLLGAVLVLTFFI